jgi:hypothetical protein
MVMSVGLSRSSCNLQVAYPSMLAEHMTQRLSVIFFPTTFGTTFFSFVRWFPSQPRRSRSQRHFSRVGVEDIYKYKHRQQKIAQMSLTIQCGFKECERLIPNNACLCTLANAHCMKCRWVPHATRMCHTPEGDIVMLEHVCPAVVDSQVEFVCWWKLAQDTLQVTQKAPGWVVVMSTCRF